MEQGSFLRGEKTVLLVLCQNAGTGYTVSASFYILIFYKNIIFILF